VKIKTKKDRRVRIQLRQRRRFSGTTERPRLSVFRSLAHIYVQVVDDRQGRTIASASTLEPGLKARLEGDARGGNRAGARQIGKIIAERLRERGISRVVFDRGGFLYHGRVREVADGAREGGLEF
jgi:large subunit ribosomal protein L18